MMKVMNNMKSKNIMKFSLLIIVLGMSMSERVCGMENEEDCDSGVNENGKVDLNDNDIEEILKTKQGQGFISTLKRFFTIYYGGSCFKKMCCLRKKKDLIVDQSLGKNGNSSIVQGKLGDSLKKFLSWKNGVVSFSSSQDNRFPGPLENAIESLSKCEITKKNGSIRIRNDYSYTGNGNPILE
jgi:hypothetical protein